MANEPSLTAISNRLTTAPVYTPATMDGFSNWYLEAGDIVAVKRGNLTYNVPVHNQTIEWAGKTKSTLEARGNKQRDSIAKAQSNAYGGGGSGSAISNEEEKAWLDIDAINGLISAQAEKISLKADKIDLEGCVTASQLTVIGLETGIISRGQSHFGDIICTYISAKDEIEAKTLAGTNVYCGNKNVATELAYFTDCTKEQSNGSVTLTFTRGSGDNPVVINFNKADINKIYDSCDVSTISTAYKNDDGTYYGWVKVTAKNESGGTIKTPPQNKKVGCTALYKAAYKDGWDAAKAKMKFVNKWADYLVVECPGETQDSTDNIYIYPYISSHGISNRGQNYADVKVVAKVQYAGLGIKKSTAACNVQDTKTVQW